MLYAGVASLAMFCLGRLVAQTLGACLIKIIRAQIFEAVSLDRLKSFFNLYLE